LRLLTIAVAQPKKTSNPLTEAKKYISQASREKSNIIFFPEYFIQKNGSPVQLSDELVGSFRVMAKEYEIYVTTGIFETGNYSSSIIINRFGTILGSHRKTILTEMEKTERGIREGNDLSVFGTEFGRIGICICLENWFPENARVLRLKGAEMIFAPSEFGMKWAGGDYLERWRMLNIVRAMENEVYYISCTNAFNEHPLAIIVDPEGLVLAERHTEGLLVSELDLEKAEKFQKDEAKPYYCANIRLNKRRPNLYGSICQILE